jgi:hypothetical protein
LSTFLKKGLNMADAFFDDLFQTVNFIDCAWNLSTRWRSSSRNARIYVLTIMQEQTKQSSLSAKRLASAPSPRTTSSECADSYYRRKPRYYSKHQQIFSCVLKNFTYRHVSLPYDIPKPILPTKYYNRAFRFYVCVFISRT